MATKKQPVSSGIGCLAAELVPGLDDEDMTANPIVRLCKKLDHIGLIVERQAPTGRGKVWAHILNYQP